MSLRVWSQLSSTFKHHQSAVVLDGGWRGVEDSRVEGFPAVMVFSCTASITWMMTSAAGNAKSFSRTESRRAGEPDVPVFSKPKETETDPGSVISASSPLRRRVFKMCFTVSVAVPTCVLRSLGLLLFRRCSEMVEIVPLRRFAAQQRRILISFLVSSEATAGRKWKMPWRILGHVVRDGRAKR